jgi:hypothetical protein
VEVDYSTLPCAAALSPSLAVDTADAFEVKFLLAEREAARVEAWARQRLLPDPHGHNGTYLTTTLYLDTASLDVYHKSSGYRRSKYRLRRYGGGAVVHLEHKKRKGDRVRKRREVLPLADLPRLLDGGTDGWFGRCIQERMLHPVSWVGYARTAFVGSAHGGGLRLTLDRGLQGMPASGWTLPERIDGRELLPGEAILELKFRSALPGLFRDLLGNLSARPAGRSKYARCVEACRLAREGG